MLEEQRAEAQQTLDELFNERLLPFELAADRLDSIGGEEYIVRFRDHRLRSIDVSWIQGQPFKDVFRAAIVERLRRMSTEERTR